MNTFEKDVPVNALKLSLGEFELADNGENSKTAPVKMLAKGAAPIEHWFWGKVAWDFAGMKMKDRIPIDYCHDDKEVIGYLNRKEVTPDGLYMTGALVPFKDSDRATEIIHKKRENVPYEASINFNSPVKIEELDVGMSSQVNGYTFDGPGVIIREWILRGVAVCPYGADMNTDTSLLADSNKLAKATFFNNKKEVDMAENKDKKLTAEAEGKAAEAAPVEADKTENKAEAQPEKAVAVEADKIEPEKKPAEEKVLSMKESDFKKMVSEFGEKIATETLLSGGSYADAQGKYLTQLKADLANSKAENEQLKKLSNKTGADAVDFEEKDTKKKLSLTDVIKKK